MSTSVNETKSTKGYIYVISNAGMPGLFKIGKTTRTPDDRLTDIQQHPTWVSPLPYVVEWAVYVDNIHTAENKIHKVLKPFRVNKKREWFQIPKFTTLGTIYLYDSDDSDVGYTFDTWPCMSLEHAVDEFRHIITWFIDGIVVKNDMVYIPYIDEEDVVKLKPSLQYESDSITYHKTQSGELILFDYEKSLGKTVYGVKVDLE
jgi:hypothetical protein